MGWPRGGSSGRWGLSLGGRERRGGLGGRAPRQPSKAPPTNLHTGNKAPANQRVGLHVRTHAQPVVPSGPPIWWGVHSCQTANIQPLLPTLLNEPSLTALSPLQGTDIPLTYRFQGCICCLGKPFVLENTVFVPQMVV